ncbi:hypothetical protein M2337_002394 [Sphingobium sp. B2D3A]|uniref:hypothetical protein n=1 Tax=unclassified Sphingobium TaxID=2611147 RepID=UPI0022240DF1|nr:MULTISPECIES: hypothetical protein [unclassified Sphingobium]MCW2338161.1 hypothetical protein [Sphingobium sp. B2D3A]MCW2384620.1 hypothetical protein [Sphingobium sp. B2D3D]
MAIFDANLDRRAPLSPKRARLASFENAYAVAVQRHRETGAAQFVLRTGNPAQPFRLTTSPPTHTDQLQTLVA